MDNRIERKAPYTPTNVELLSHRVRHSIGEIIRSIKGNKARTGMAALSAAAASAVMSVPASAETRPIFDSFGYMSDGGAETSKPVNLIAFGPDYIGKTPEREAQAQDMLNSLWDSAAAKSPTLAERVEYMRKYTQTSPAKLMEYRERGLVHGISDFEVRAPDLSVWREEIAKSNTAVDHLLGVFQYEESLADGSKRAVFNVKHLLLIGKTDVNIPGDQINQYAEYLLLPHAMIRATNQEVSRLVREGKNTTEALLPHVNVPESEFGAVVRARAWRYLFIDVQNAYKDNPNWKTSKPFNDLYEGWLAVADAGEEAQMNYTRTIPYKPN